MSQYYFVGIKGAGMSALAQMLFDQGHEVLGCDYEEDYYTTVGLSSRDIVVETFDNACVNPMVTVIVGNAFIEHPFVQELKRKKIQVITYSECLGKLSKDYFSIAISGTHGKTTTTNICRQLLLKQEEINYIVGDGLGGGNSLSKQLVFEACEYKRHFLNYYPKLAIITNIDYDHPDYYKNIEDVRDAFSSFIKNSRFIVYNGDDPHLKAMTHKIQKSISFGLLTTNDFYASSISNDETYTAFDVYYKQRFFDHVKLPLFGNHNVANALAAIAVAVYMGVTKNEIRAGLLHYKPSKRRFEVFESEKQIIVSDYAHHPTEIKATYEALRSKYKQKELIAIFEPHTFSRTKQFVGEFKEALELFDFIYLKEIFTSVREQDETIRLSELADSIKDCVILTDLFVLRKHENAVLIFMGAGNIDKTAEMYYNSCSKKS